MFLITSLALCAWLYLAFAHGQFWMPLRDPEAPEPSRWPSVDIVIPARNEVKTLPQTLPTLLAQDYPGAWRVLLVDDHSTDGTSAVAQMIARSSSKLTIINAPDLPEGWSGKVAAMQAGTTKSFADFILFTDADIAHPADSLRRLVARAIADKLDLTSQMAKLHCESLAEKLLIPAFVFFFAMLYPFRRANDPKSRVAAAAGGVMLVRKTMLESIGGLERIKNALIDDCSLARAIKDRGGRLRLTLTEKVQSTRPYPRFSDVHAMIARCAFTQLHHRVGLLLGTLIGLGLLFLVPVIVPLLTACPTTALIGSAAWVLMAALYTPMVRFYGLPWVWAITLPLAAALYMVATLDSARRYFHGQSGQWKGRTQV